MRAFDSLVRVARWLPEPVVRVLVFSLISRLFILRILVLFIIVPFERAVRLKWRRHLRGWEEWAVQFRWSRLPSPNSRIL